MARPDLEEKYARRKQDAPADAWGREGDRKVRRVQNHPVYAAMVEAMDLAIGEVLDSLTAMEIDDRTVVIFVSDNGGLSTSDGYPTSNLPLRAGKGWLFEGGIRVPLIIKWPGVTRPGSISTEPVITHDFYPTVIDIAGLSSRPQQQVDGVSLTPLLRGQAALGREALYWHFPHYGNPGGPPGGAIRSGDWKMIEYFEDGRLELYNVVDDIGEQSDLSARNPEKAAELSAQLRVWQTDVRARFPEEIGMFERWWRKIF